MPDLRLVPAAGCDCCGKTAEAVETELGAPLEAACSTVTLCHDCARAIIKKFEEGGGHYG